jgi:hypothetical protein
MSFSCYNEYTRLAAFVEVYNMPVYKADGKKDGLQKYNIRVNYTDNNGKARQLTRTAYG